MPNTVNPTPDEALTPEELDSCISFLKNTIPFTIMRAFFCVLLALLGIPLLLDGVQILLGIGVLLFGSLGGIHYIRKSWKQFQLLGAIKKMKR